MECGLAHNLGKVQLLPLYIYIFQWSVVNNRTWVHTFLLFSNHTMHPGVSMVYWFIGSIMIES